MIMGMAIESQRPCASYFRCNREFLPGVREELVLRGLDPHQSPTALSRLHIDEHLCTNKCAHAHVCGVWMQMCGCIHKCPCVHVRLYSCAQTYSCCERLRQRLGFCPFPWLISSLSPLLTQTLICALLLQAMWKSVPRALPWTTSGTERLLISPLPSVTQAPSSGGSCSA
jgi:hypothetical protein